MGREREFGKACAPYWLVVGLRLRTDIEGESRAVFGTPKAMLRK